MLVAINDITVGISKQVELYTPCSYLNCEARIAVRESEEGIPCVDLDHWNNTGVVIVIVKNSTHIFCSRKHMLETEA